MTVKVTDPAATNAAPTTDLTQTNPSADNPTTPVDNAAAATPATATQTPAAQPELTLDSYGDLGLVETESIKINPEVTKAFKQLALDNKISPEVAKKLAQFQYQETKKVADEYDKMVKGWEEENKRTYGDNLKNIQTNAARVLAELDKDGKFKELLHLAGAENAPATLAFLKNIGDQLLEKPSVSPNAAPVVTEKELEDFYTN